MATAISSEALAVLHNAHYASGRLFITRDELPGKVYAEVKDVCKRIGGTWNTASQSFLFSYEPTLALEVLVASGELPPKNPFDFFVTPDPIIETMMRYSFNLFGCNQCEGYRHNRPLHYCEYLPKNLRILEPSAGQGRILYWVQHLYAMLERDDYVLHCCELNPVNQGVLRKQGFLVVRANFLDYHLKPGEPLYDVILMNPPFQDHQFIDHIEHAWKLLKPGGRLVFIGPNSFLWHTDERCLALHTLARCYHDDLPDINPRGAFRKSGTDVETVLVPLVKQDMAWKMQPYNGFFNWYCYMLDFQISQSYQWYQKKSAIWKQIDQGDLPDNPECASWEQTSKTLRSFFFEVVEQARKEWIEIQLDEASLIWMERMFLDEGRRECGCERHVEARKRFWEAEPQEVLRSAEPRAPALVNASVVKKESADEERSPDRTPPQLSKKHYVQLPLF